jgi:putative N6-adenine-specific DNA methylase
LEQELRELGAEGLAPTPGGVGFSGRFKLCWRVNLQSRVASRVLWQVAQGPYRTEEDVYHLSYDVPWPDWLSPRGTFRVKVDAQHCPLRSLEFLTLRIKDAVCDRFIAGKQPRPSIDKSRPDHRIHAFLDQRQITLYLDTSGEPLFKRGYRKAMVEAPLRENLAAGLLKLAGWSPLVPLLDPFCGGGSIVIEAGLIAAGKAPGVGRRFAFERLPNFSRSQWEACRAEARAMERHMDDVRIMGGDMDPRAVQAALTNVKAAGFEGMIHLRQADALSLPRPPETGIMVSNPPYGVRLRQNEQIDQLYRKLGHWLKRSLYKWKVFLLSEDLSLPSNLGLKPSRRIPLFNGSLECRLYEFEIVQGSHRRVKASDRTEVTR